MLMQEVPFMNKKNAIAYGKIALDSLLHSTYKINLENFEVEMKQAFKVYPQNIAIQIANAKIYAERKLKNLKNGCDVCNE